jgi:hypothetical protein
VLVGVLGNSRRFFAESILLLAAFEESVACRVHVLGSVALATDEHMPYRGWVLHCVFGGAPVDELDIGLGFDCGEPLALELRAELRNAYARLPAAKLATQHAAIEFRALIRCGADSTRPELFWCSRDWLQRIMLLWYCRDWLQRMLFGERRCG